MSWKCETSKESLMFDVTKTPIYVRRDGKYRNLKKEANRVALWNTDEEELLSLVSDQYKPINHGSVINSFENALEQMNIEPIDVQYLTTPNKNKMWMHVDLKTVDATIDPVENIVDQWKLGVVVIHGLDSYAGLLILPAITRMVCTNGMWVKKLLGTRKMTHRTIGLEEWFSNNIKETLSELAEKFELIPRLHEVNIEMEGFNKKVEKMFGKRFMEETMEQIHNPSSVNPLYRVHQNSLSLYDAMSSLTYINQLHSENVGAYLIEQRHTNIERLINSYLVSGE